ncbi:unnamed protein product [Rotaria sp. Silwood1]|nr:unnamed protein product [Rotaria sp. Silwood1]CAF4995623.1 unnamed protein product [Rotaria sp. Silwood1]
MARNYDTYTPQFKHTVLEQYRPGIFGYGFKSLAKRFKIQGGHRLIMSWYRQWNGTVESLNRKRKGGRPRTMTQEDVKDHILEFVESMNNKHVYVNYKIVQAHIKSVLKREVPIRTIRQYGKDNGIKWKKTRETTLRDADDSFWNNIGQFRRSLQRIGTSRFSTDLICAWTIL